MSEAIIWFTGLPASGKSTLARRVHAHFVAAGRKAVLLDSDELRHVLDVRPRALYALDERDRFYHSLAALAALLARQGMVVLVAATAPRRQDRDRARAEVMAAGTFVEVWIKTPFSECQARDPKGLYAQARRSGATELPGVGAAYEPPLAPEVIADGGLDDAAVAAIERQLDGGARCRASTGWVDAGRVTVLPGERVDATAMRSSGPLQAAGGVPPSVFPRATQVVPRRYDAKHDAQMAGERDDLGVKRLA